MEVSKTLIAYSQLSRQWKTQKLIDLNTHMHEG